MSLLQNSNAISTGGAYDLTDSVRFRSSASAYLSRTPASAGNRKTFTFSAWIKKSSNGTDYKEIFTAFNSSTSYSAFDFSDTDQLRWDEYGVGNIKTNAVYRDNSAWYHIVLTVDTTQATASNRVKIYVNGEQVTSFASATYPSQNYNTQINNTVIHQIARNPYAPYYQQFDGYLTEVNFVDGQALTPSDFGNYDAITGVWKPKKYTGTYGTNGFYLPMNQTVETYDATYLSVAGGGGGGTDVAGGGGAGGYLTGTTTLIPTNVYTATIGAGGAGAPNSSTKGTSGGNSSLIGSGVSITSIGGGGGGSLNNRNGLSGGSGGAGTNPGGVAGAGTPGQGFAGGISSGTQAGGGGGGASEIGVNSAPGNTGGRGGNGLASSITGTSITYAGGGGGGGYSGTASNGGTGGGGKGEGYGSDGSGTAGTNGLGGGGGGGGGGAVGYGKAGGSGVVILRVPTAKYTGTVTGSPTVTTDGSYTVIKFTASGTYTA